MFYDNFYCNILSLFLTSLTSRSDWKLVQENLKEIVAGFVDELLQPDANELIPKSD